MKLNKYISKHLQNYSLLNIRTINLHSLFPLILSNNILFYLQCIPSNGNLYINYHTCVNKKYPFLNKGVNEASKSSVHFMYYIFLPYDTLFQYRGNKIAFMKQQGFNVYQEFRNLDVLTRLNVVV